MGTQALGPADAEWWWRPTKDTRYARHPSEDAPKGTWTSYKTPFNRPPTRRRLHAHLVNESGVLVCAECTRQSVYRSVRIPRHHSLRIDLEHSVGADERHRDRVEVGEEVGG